MFNNSVKYRMNDCKGSSTLEGMGRFIHLSFRSSLCSPAVTEIQTVRLSL